MIIPKRIFVHSKLEKELKKRWLWSRFEKAKSLILLGHVSGGPQFGLMEPKHQGIRYFRITRQFRVLGSFDTSWDLYLTVLDNHQNM